MTDMDKLRATLALLHDEDEELGARLTRAINEVKGMGPAILTAVLHVAFPERCGVWNATSEQALKMLGMWPEFPRGTAFGDRYVRVNEVLNDFAEEVDVDLWTLDALFWWICDREEEAWGPITDPPVAPQALSKPQSRIERQDQPTFGLEKHLQEFLRDNWQHTELGAEWSIYEEPGQPDLGYEYPCGVGRIDILARHRRDSKWLVLELKRNQTSDDTVGQILRYMGWVKSRLATDDESVEGMIIASDGDDRLRYALEVVPNVRLMRYRVNFQLIEPE